MRALEPSTSGLIPEAELKQVLGDLAKKNGLSPTPEQLAKLAAQLLKEADPEKKGGAKRDDLRKALDNAIPQLQNLLGNEPATEQTNPDKVIKGLESMPKGKLSEYDLIAAL